MLNLNPAHPDKVHRPLQVLEGSLGASPSALPPAAIGIGERCRPGGVECVQESGALLRVIIRVGKLEALLAR